MKAISLTESPVVVSRLHAWSRRTAFRYAQKMPIKRVTHSAKKLQAVYDLGRKAANERLTEIRAFLT